MEEIYVSTDIEADGFLPGDYSMLSFGSAAFTARKEIIGTFSANLHTLPGARQDPATMKWWKQFPQAWQECRNDLQVPEVAMKNYAQWLKDLPGVPVFVGYPAAFDFIFIYWYLHTFAGECPFSYVALDIKTYAMAMLKKPFSSIKKRAIPRHLFDEDKQTHVALMDAIEQGKLFCNMLAENTR